MSIFPPEVSEKMKSSDWWSGEDFEGEGQVVQVVSVEPVASAYGAAEDSYWVEQDILQVGQTFRYTLKDAEGVEKKWDSTSRPLAIGLQQAEVEANDWIKLQRAGKGKDTRYTATKVEAPVSPAKADEELDPKSIPF